jgi:hypothetical protein
VHVRLQMRMQIRLRGRMRVWVRRQCFPLMGVFHQLVRKVAEGIVVFD